MKRLLSTAAVTLAAIGAGVALPAALPAHATCHSPCSVKVVRGGASQADVQTALALQAQRDRVALERERLELEAYAINRNLELQRDRLEEARDRALDAYELELRRIDRFSHPRLYDFDLFPDRFGVVTDLTPRRFQPGFTRTPGIRGRAADPRFVPLPATHPTPTGALPPGSRSVAGRH